MSQTCYHGPGRAGGAQRLCFSFPLQGPHKAGAERGTEVLGPREDPSHCPNPRGSTPVPAPCPQERLQVQPQVGGGMSHWDGHGAGVTAPREGLLHLHPSPLGWDQLAPAPSQADTRGLCWDRQKQRLQRGQWHCRDPREGSLGWMRTRECLATSPESQDCWKCRAQRCREL